MSKPDVIMAVMKLTRSMRRGPMRPGFPGPDAPGGGRMLTVLRENPNVSSRELAELLDIRPSSLTELLDRMEKEELIVRTPDENDRRVSRTALTEKGAALESSISAAHAERIEKTAACFTDEEAAQFCEMCERLSAHLSSLAAERGEGDFPPPPCGCGHHHHHHHGDGNGFHHGGFGRPESDD